MSAQAITVRIPTILRPLTGGAKHVEGSGGTLRELLADLDSRHSGLAERVVDDGALRRFVNVYVDGVDVRRRDGLATPVGAGQTVEVIQSVAGG